MCKCKAETIMTCVCTNHVPIDWTKPITVIDSNGMPCQNRMVASFLGETNTKYDGLYAVATKFYDGSGNIIVCDKYGKKLHGAPGWEGYVVNIPTPKKKVTVLTVMSPSGGVFQRTKEFVESSRLFGSYKVLKTQEFEYDAD